MKNPFSRQAPAPAPPVLAPLPPDHFLAVAQLDPRGQLPSRQSPADEGWFDNLQQAHMFLRPRGGGTIFSARADKITELVDCIENGGGVRAVE
jgi:hypothetical protein